MPRANSPSRTTPHRFADDLANGGRVGTPEDQVDTLRRFHGGHFEHDVSRLGDGPDPGDDRRGRGVVPERQLLIRGVPGRPSGRVQPAPSAEGEQGSGLSGGEVIAAAFLPGDRGQTAGRVEGEGRGPRGQFDQGFGSAERGDAGGHPGGEEQS